MNWLVLFQRIQTLGSYIVWLMFGGFLGSHKSFPSFDKHILKPYLSIDMYPGHVVNEAMFCSSKLVITSLMLVTVDAARGKTVN